MKSVFAFCLSIFLGYTQCYAQNIVQIPSGQSVEIDYPNYEAYEVSLSSKGLKSLGIKVVNKSSNEQVRGFGLNKLGKAEVLVEQGSKLVMENKSNKDIKINYRVEEKSKDVFIKRKNMVSFTLRNDSAKSIPLIIPDVMNPNLSPYSNSGVTLKVGQEILFKAKGKKRVLLVVDEEIQEGNVIEVSDLLATRKRDLNIY